MQTAQEKSQISLQNEFLTFENKLTDKSIQILYLLTINHNTAPIVIRERFAIQEYVLEQAVKSLKSKFKLDAFVILSTCNRTEIYFTTDSTTQVLDKLYRFFNEFLCLEKRIVEEYSVLYNGCDVVSHIFRLAAGLESLVLGERQILSQMKQAFTTAQTNSTLNNLLEKLFQNAIKCAKNIHQSTNISHNSQSVSSVTVDLANNICGPIKTKSVMVLGAGQMAKLALEHIVKIGGARETIVLNRSPHRVIEFSKKYKVDKSFPFDNVYEILNDVDILIVAASAPHFILLAEEFQRQRKSSSKMLYIFDVSMPRNIDPEFGRLPNIKLIDIDSIQSIYNKTTLTRNEDLDNASKIISSEIKEFESRIDKQTMDKVIKELKDKIEVEKLAKLDKLGKDKETFNKQEVEYIVSNIINSVLHVPLTNLKDSQLSRAEKEKFLRELFNLY